MPEHIYLLSDSSRSPDFWRWRCIMAMEQSLKALEMELIQTTSLDTVLGKAPSECFLLSSTIAWTCSTAHALLRHGTNPIVIAYREEGLFPHFSSVSFDYAGAIRAFLDEIQGESCRRAVFVWPDCTSCTDRVKADAFLAYDGAPEMIRDALYLHQFSSVQSACEAVLEQYDAFDAILCNNDITLHTLKNDLQAKNLHLLKDKRVFAFCDIDREGNFSQAVYNWGELGREAVRLLEYQRLDASRRRVITSVKLPMPQFFVDNRALARSFNAPDPDFPKSPDAFRELCFSMKRVLTQCDALDLDILRLYAQDMRLEDIAERLFTSESTVKYRIRRFMTMAAYADRRQFRQDLRAIFL